MRLKILTACALFLSSSISAFAADTKMIPADDVVMKAMNDELLRTKTKLKLEKFSLPYFVSYNMSDSVGLFLGSSFGAITNKNETNSRMNRTSLRIGDKKLDSDRSSFMYGDRSFVLDDDYDAIRNALWLSSDRSYKSAVENLESKKATRQYTKVEDQPDSFSDAPTVVSIKEVKNTPLASSAEWEDRLRKASGVFKEFPDITQSGVNFSTRQRIRRLVNSEGTLVKDQDGGASIHIEATAQSKDGMETSDQETFAVDSLDQLPDQKTVEETARKVANRAIELSKAKRASDYLGPILFEKEAAADLVSSVISPLLVADRFEESSYYRPATSEKKLGQRLFPEFLTIVDDPTVEKYKDIPLRGGWEIDDEGVRAQKLTLIEKGILKAVCSTRKPSRLSKESNGHCRGSGPTTGHLFVETSQPVEMADMKKKLIETAKAQGLKNALIIRKAASGYMGLDFSGLSGVQILSSLGGSRSTSTYMYSVDVTTGKEELIRGAQLRRLTKQDLRQMLACGNDTSVYSSKYPNAIVTPSLLFSELEVQKPPLETETPPHLKNPYFEAKK